MITKGTEDYKKAQNFANTFDACNTELGYDKFGYERHTPAKQEPKENNEIKSLKR